MRVVHHKVIRKFAVAAGLLVTAIAPRCVSAQANDIYSVQSFSAQIAPYSADNPYPDDFGGIGVLKGSAVIGNIYGTPGTSQCDVNIKPVAVYTEPSNQTEYIAATGSPGWPATQCYNLKYLSFGLWQEESTADPLTAWVTSGAFEAGTPRTGTIHAVWGTVNYTPYASAFYTTLAAVPKHPLVLESTPTTSVIKIDFAQKQIKLTIEFTDVSPSIVLSGQATLAPNGVSYNTFVMNLSGTGGMTGNAKGHLYGITGAIPNSVAGTFSVISSDLKVLGSFSGCRVASC
jgi:hypothetical protein